ncbi:hypothetical protein ACTXT7_016076 [Hymenolepis weldensis]
MTVELAACKVTPFALLKNLPALFSSLPIGYSLRILSSFAFVTAFSYNTDLAIIAARL